MQNLISVSGGKDSTALLLLAIERGEENISGAFCDTGNEHPQTLAKAGTNMPETMNDQPTSPDELEEIDLRITRPGRSMAFGLKTPGSEMLNVMGCMTPLPKAGQTVRIWDNTVWRFWTVVPVGGQPDLFYGLVAPVVTPKTKTILVDIRLDKSPFSSFIRASFSNDRHYQAAIDLPGTRPQIAEALRFLAQVIDNDPLMSRCQPGSGD